MKLSKSLVIIFLCLISNELLAQNVTISPTGINPAPTGSIPRLNYDAIITLPSPQLGDLAIDLTYKCLRFYNGTKWVFFMTSQDYNQPALTAWREGGSYIEIGQSITTDVNGNLYVTGLFMGTATFGNITVSTVPGNSLNTDAFILKYNNLGVIQWVKTAGGPQDDSGASIAVDVNENVYVTGTFRGTMTIGSSNITSAGNTDIFLAKYNNVGNLQWVERAGGVSNDNSSALSLDNNGSPFIIGTFSSTANFGIASLTSSGETDIYIAKYNDLGVIQWVQKAGGSNIDSANSLVLDNNGNVFITGSFTGTATFGANNLTSSGNSDIFIAKYVPITSSWSFVTKAGGSFSDTGNSITIDAGGNIFITGSFGGTCLFSTLSITSTGDEDIFIARCNSSGVFEMVQKAGGSSVDSGSSITIDANANIYVTGYFYGTATFGSTNLSSIGTSDIFVAKYNWSGVIQWVVKAGGTVTGYDSGRDIMVGNNGQIYVTGGFGGTGTFGSTILTSAGGGGYTDIDLYIMRLNN